MRKSYNKDKKNGRYIDGRSKKKYYCKNCGKRISIYSGIYGGGRCKECGNKIQASKLKNQFTGSNNFHFKGQTINGGYVYIYLPEHSRANFQKIYVKRADLIMEKHLGRYLIKEEIVHHINGIRDDDRIENLMLFANNKEHIKQEYQNRRKRKGKFIKTKEVK